MYAKFSPAGDRVAYVRQGDLYVERLGDGAITRLTTGADSLHVNGMTDWVYEEEFGAARRVPLVARTGSRIAYWHFDMTGVGTFHLINDTDSLYPIVMPIQYPKVGHHQLGRARSASSSAAGGARPPGSRSRATPATTTCPRMEWAGSDELVIQRINRLQNTDRVMLADAAHRATVRTVLDRAGQRLGRRGRRPAAGSPSDKEFLWVSERDGWRHVYRVVRATGAESRRITPGDFDVDRGRRRGRAGGWLYFSPRPDNATQRYLYRDPAGRSRRPRERVTPADQPGTHALRLSPDAPLGVPHLVRGSTRRRSSTWSALPVARGRPDARGQREPARGAVAR